MAFRLTQVSYPELLKENQIYKIMSNIKYLALFLIGIFLLFLCSCTAEQQLARIHKKRPDLFQKDTIRIHDTGSVQLKPTDTTTLNQLDSLLNALMDCSTSILDTSKIKQPSNNNIHNIKGLAKNLDKERLKEKIKNIYLDKPCIAPGDTLEYNVNDTFIVKVWQVGNRLMFSHYKLITTEKAIITEGETPAWKNYLIAGLIAVSILMLLLLLIRR